MIYAGDKAAEEMEKKLATYSRTKKKARFAYRNFFFKIYNPFGLDSNAKRILRYPLHLCMQYRKLLHRYCRYDCSGPPLLEKLIVPEGSNESLKSCVF